MSTNETLEKKKVVYTGSIPQCPHCDKPTRRTGGAGEVTSAYYQPIYDENGKNTNPDRNTITNHWECLECGRKYSTKGNHHDGFHYS